MQTWNVAEPLTLESLLQSVGIPLDSYIEALEHSATRHMVILKRQVHEQFTNNYNPLFMHAWQANMDIQLMLDTYACVMYVTSYLCKSERTMSELLKQASKQCKKRDMDIKQRLSVLGNVFLTHRDISTDEAIYRLFSIPLRESNRKVIFVPTDVPEKTTRLDLLKAKKALEDLAEDSTEIFQTSIPDKYAARPDDLEHMCYADFTSRYNTTASTRDYNDSVDVLESAADQQDNILESASDQPEDVSESAADQPEDASESAADQPEDASESAADQPEDASESAADQPDNAVESAADKQNKAVESSADQNIKVTITLKNKLGKMYRMKTPRLIRFHAVPERKDPEGYSHRL